MDYKVNLGKLNMSFPESDYSPKMNIEIEGFEVEVKDLSILELSTFVTDVSSQIFKIFKKAHEIQKES